MPLSRAAESRHENQMGIPTYSGGEEQVVALRRTCERLSDSGKNSFNQQADELVRRMKITISADSVGDFAKRNTKPRYNIQPHLWSYFAEKFRTVLKDELHSATLSTAGYGDPLLVALQEFLTPGERTDAKRLARMQGTFAIFRRSFIDPHHVMVGAMLCGVDGHPPSFQISHTYRSERGKTKQETVKGVMVPFKESILFMGQIAGKSAPFIFVLTNFDEEAGAIEEASGVLLVAKSGTHPSATALAVLRRDALPDPASLPEDSLDSVDGGLFVCRAMKRGEVKWRLE